MTDFNQLKSQIITLMTVKDNTDGLFNILYMFVLMSIIQAVFESIPKIKEIGYAYFEKNILSNCKRFFCNFKFEISKVLNLFFDFLITFN